MAALQLHFLHWRPPPPLMSHNTHIQHKTRPGGSVQMFPGRNSTRICTRTGSGRGSAVLCGLGSIDQTSLQSLTTPLLRGGYIAVSLAILIFYIPSPKIIAYRQILLTFGGRGKTMQDSSSNKLIVPKQFFSHYYILGSIWTTILLVATWMYAYEIESSVSMIDYKYRIWNSVFLLLLMEVQVLSRLFEYVFVFKHSPSAQMHIVFYLLSISYYIAAPLSLCCMFSSELFEFVRSSFAEFVVKGLQITEFDFWGHVNPLLQMNWCVWIGAAVFSWGWIHQRRCHAILGSLRDNKRKGDDYTIPHGDWFEYVSSPHYLAEIVIYVGFVIASGCSDITIWSLFGLVVANLTFTAAQTHNWYLGKFKNYPKSRKAIFPFIY